MESRKGSKKKTRSRKGGLLAIVVFLLIAILRIAFPQSDPEGVPATVQTNGVSGLEVHFIDVGQGDATLIKADGHAMLIDAGENDKGTAVQLYLKKQGVERLDYLVLSHTDSDHIGGADVIISKFDIGQIFLSDFKKDNKTYRELMDSMKSRNMTFSTPEVGAEYELGDAVVTFIAPNDTYEDPNNSSIAAYSDGTDITWNCSPSDSWQSGEPSGSGK